MELNLPQPVAWIWEAGFLPVGPRDVMATNIDPQTVAQMYRDYGAVVYRRALRLLSNPQDAEEATQEVFVRVMRTEAGYAGKGELMGWLYRITTHYCLNRIRDKRRRQDLFQLHVAPTLSSACSSSSSSQADMVMMRWLLANADERQAQAAIYVYVDGMSYEEAAPLLGVSKRTVGNLLERFQMWCSEKLRTATASGEFAGLAHARTQVTARS